VFNDLPALVLFVLGVGMADEDSWFFHGSGTGTPEHVNL